MNRFLYEDNLIRQWESQYSQPSNSSVLSFHSYLDMNKVLLHVFVYVLD